MKIGIIGSGAIGGVFANKLQSAGYLTTYSQEYQGRKRKYYSLTEEGKAQIAYLSNEWQIYKDTVDGIIEGRIRG